MDKSIEDKFLLENVNGRDEVSTFATRSIADGIVEGDIKITLDPAQRPREADFSSALSVIEDFKNNINPNSILRQGVDVSETGIFVYSFSRTQNGLDFKATGSLNEQKTEDSNIKINIYGASDKKDVIDKLSGLIEGSRKHLQESNLDEKISSRNLVKAIMTDIPSTPFENTQELSAKDMQDFAEPTKETEGLSLDDIPDTNESPEIEEPSQPSIGAEEIGLD